MKLLKSKVGDLKPGEFAQLLDHTIGDLAIACKLVAVCTDKKKLKLLRVAFTKDKGLRSRAGVLPHRSARHRGPTKPPDRFINITCLDKVLDTSQIARNRTRGTVVAVTHCTPTTEYKGFFNLSIQGCSDL